MGCAGSKEGHKTLQKPAPTPGRTDCGPWLKSVDDLVDFPLFPEGTKSLLFKHLSKEIWDEYKDQTDDCGVPFKLCILSGCQNVDSGIGLYAGSHSSYKKFHKLFDPVIEEYHGHPIDGKHVSEMTCENLEAPALPEDEAKMIKSTRIRVGRNLADFALGPGITNEQRKEIMNTVVTALSTLEGDLAGKFYPIAGMKEEDRAQLVADHFLFKQGDRFLEACNLNRDWPNGRGIFHNNDKTFLVWVNEEDQLRIISMQPGADIGCVFDRLCRAVAHIETVAKFAHDDHLGYITSCPTNLGTALRGSVHIQLPLLSKDTERFEAIAKKYNVQIRGIHGEHSESTDGTYDISNRHRLGKGERTLVQEMYLGIKAMIAAEKELQAKQ